MGKLYSWMRLAVFIFLVNHSYAKIYDAALLQNIDEMGGLVMIEYALSMYSINTALSEFKNGNANADVSLLNTPPNDRNSSEYNDEKYKPDTAAEAWEFGGSAWPYEDWIRNAANIENSGAQKFFSDWVRNLLFQIRPTIFPASPEFLRHCCDAELYSEVLANSS